MFEPFEKIKHMVNWLVGVRIMARPDQLIIQDRRPTWPMLLGGVGAIAFPMIFVLRYFFGNDVGVDSFGMWAIGVAALVCIGLSFRGTIGEQYVFDRPSDTYQFARRFIYKKEVIEGTLTQFRGVGVVTTVTEDTDGNSTEKHSVVLRQDGLLFGASPNQPIRESKPALNFWNTEARIAQAIHKFLNIPRVDAE
jgi:hypothetical protein